jgi:nucleoid-associated protein YgaU
MTTKIIVDCSTGVVEEVELTEEELAQREADRIAFEAAEAEQEAEAAEKAAKKAQLLAKLGITEDDAKLLLS